MGGLLCPLLPRLEVVAVEEFGEVAFPVDVAVPVQGEEVNLAALVELLVALELLVLGEGDDLDEDWADTDVTGAAAGFC